jgi:site-specific DNA-methyltransferase (adenine-specific)
MSSFNIVVDDACSFLAGLEAESVDLVITDPAYESLEKHRAKGTTTRLKKSDGSSNEWFPIFPNERFLELFSLLWRVMKQDTHFYMFCDQETMFVAKPLAETVGFKFWKPIVWQKRSIGMGYHYRARYEFILFFEKGKRRLSNLSVSDVLGHDPGSVLEDLPEDRLIELLHEMMVHVLVPDIIEAKRVYRGYPTEKPVEAITTLVTQSSEPGQLIIDPFSGSGATGVAAIQQGRNYLGVDIKESAVERSIERLKEAGGEHVQELQSISALVQGTLF